MLEAQCAARYVNKLSESATSGFKDDKALVSQADASRSSSRDRTPHFKLPPQPPRLLAAKLGLYSGIYLTSKVRRTRS